MKYLKKFENRDVNLYKEIIEEVISPIMDKEFKDYATWKINDIEMERLMTEGILEFRIIVKENKKEIIEKHKSYTRVLKTIIKVDVIYEFLKEVVYKLPEFLPDIITKTEWCEEWIKGVYVGCKIDKKYLRSEKAGLWDMKGVNK